jgi:hypothetical protein
MIAGGIITTISMKSIFEFGEVGSEQHSVIVRPATFAKAPAALNWWPAEAFGVGGTGRSNIPETSVARFRMTAAKRAARR